VAVSFAVPNWFDCLQFQIGGFRKQLEGQFGWSPNRLILVSYLVWIFFHFFGPVVEESPT